MNKHFLGSFQIINLAVMGYNAEQKLVVIKTKCSSLQSDFIIIGYVLDDPLETGGIGEMKGQLHPKSLTSRMKSKIFRLSYGFYKELSNRYHNKFPKKKDYKKLSRTYAEISQYAKSNGMQLLVIIFPALIDYKDYKFAEDHQKVKEILKSQSIPYIDLLDYYAAYDGNILRIKSDDSWHPNKLGNEIAVNQTFTYFLEHKDIFPGKII